MSESSVSISAGLGGTGSVPICANVRESIGDSMESASGMPTWSLPYAKESLSAYSDLTVGTEPNVQNMQVAGSLKGSNWLILHT